MLSLDLVKELIQDNSKISSKLVSIKENIINQCLEKLEHAMSLYQRLYDLYIDLMANQILFPIKMQKNVYNNLNAYQSQLNKVKADFVDILTEVRKGGKKPIELVTYLAEELEQRVKEDKEDIFKGKSLITFAYDLLDKWRVEITQKINYMSIFSELERDVIVATDSFPIRVTKKMQASMVVFYFSKYTEILTFGIAGFEMMYKFHNACKLIDDANKIDRNEPHLGEYLIIDGELQPHADLFIKNEIVRDGEVRIAFFENGGMM